MQNTWLHLENQQPSNRDLAQQEGVHKPHSQRGLSGSKLQGLAQKGSKPSRQVQKSLGPRGAPGDGSQLPAREDQRSASLVESEGRARPKLS